MTFTNPFLLCYTSLIPEFYSTPNGTYALNATHGLKRHGACALNASGPPGLKRQPEQGGSPTMTPSRRFLVSVSEPSPRALRSILKKPPAHRDESLLPGDAQDRVVRSGSARGRVDKHVNVLVENERRGGLAEHDIKILGAKHRLSRVECQPR